MSSLTKVVNGKVVTNTNVGTPHHVPSSLMLDRSNLQLDGQSTTKTLAVKLNGAKMERSLILSALMAFPDRSSRSSGPGTAATRSFL